MNDSNPRVNRRLALLVLASFAVFASAVVLRVGIGATPYETMDSLGRPMGFNDPLHAEHYGIILRNFNAASLLSREYTYEWVLLGAHLAGACILLSSRAARARLARWFFAAQVLVFPLGVPAMFLLPFLVAGWIAGPMDREGFIDIPFILAVSQPVWVAASVIIAIGLRTPKAAAAGRGQA